MASLAQRLAEVAEELTAIEEKWRDQRVPESQIAKVIFWRDVVLEGAYALNSGSHRTIPDGQTPRVLGIRAMRQKLHDLRWQLTPSEYQEYQREGALYGSVMDSILDEFAAAGYDIVKHA